MDSEIALDAEVKALLELAASPELYPQFVRAGGPALVAQVLVHENADIALGAVDLLAEITDTDALEGAEEEAEALVGNLVRLPPPPPTHTLSRTRLCTPTCTYTPT